MSNSLSFDPKNGFIALPVELLELDLTPGAFRTLIEFCKMSNLDGFCWPSLAQIGKKLNRSKASISAYVKELRTTGLLKTHEQKTATGYNYRLKFELTFWKSWRSKMTVGKADEAKKATTPALKTTKRRDQPTERNNINHNHKNQKEDSSVFNDLKIKWAELTKHQNYPNFTSTPKQKLIDETIGLVNSLKTSSEDISTDIKFKLEKFIQAHKISSNVDKQLEMASILLNHFSSKNHINSFFVALEDMWKPFWKHLPSQKQLKDLIASLELPPSEAQQTKLLRGYISRWEHWSNATKKVA